MQGKDQVIQEMKDDMEKITLDKQDFEQLCMDFQNQNK